MHDIEWQLTILYNLGVIRPYSNPPHSAQRNLPNAPQPRIREGISVMQFRMGSRAICWSYACVLAGLRVFFSCWMHARLVEVFTRSPSERMTDWEPIGPRIAIRKRERGIERSNKCLARAKGACYASSRQLSGPEDYFMSPFEIGRSISSFSGSFSVLFFGQSDLKTGFCLFRIFESCGTGLFETERKNSWRRNEIRWKSRKLIGQSISGA